MSLMDHVALVVPRLEPVLERVCSWGLSPGPIEAFPGEGTREAYVGGGEETARLLLMEPTDDSGPYARALRRRGPGLHHVARRVEDLDGALAALGGWLLHPRSVVTVAECRTAWLVRPGVGTLLELSEGPAPEGPPVVEALQVPCLPELEGLLQLVGGLTRAPDGAAWLTLAGRRVGARDLAEGRPLS